MNWKIQAPNYGDIIRTKVSFYYHYGIFVDENNIIQFGLPGEATGPAENVRVLKSDIYTFLSSGELEVGVPSVGEKAKMRSREQIVRLATDKIGSGGYDILHNNCEHFVNECAFGEKNSAFLDDVRKKLREKLGKK